MKTKLYNAKVLLTNTNTVFDGEIHITDDLITNIIKGKSAENEVFDKSINVKGNVIMSGFKNCHTHSAMTLLRSLADDMPLLQWLSKQIFPNEAKLTGEDVYWGSKLAVLEYLSGGVTTISDMYFFTDNFVEAVTSSGMRTVSVGGTCSSETCSDEKAIEQLEANYNKYNNIHPLFSYKLGFHAEYTASRNLLTRIADLSNKLKAPVYTHLAESQAECALCMTNNGNSPTQELNKYGIFKNGGAVYHAVHMSDDDLKILKDNSISVVTNCGSNIKLASGIAPIKQMLNCGINVAIGTDGAASNNCLDMFREMFLVCGLSKIKNNDASVVSATQVLKMATVNGANAIGLECCDSIAIGKKADLIIIDLNQPNMQPLHNIAQNIVYSGSKSNIKMTIIDGIIRYDNGKYNIGEDIQTIYKKCNIIAKKFYN